MSNHAAGSFNRTLDRSRVLALATYIVVAIIALCSRLLDQGQFLNNDEALFWLRRSNVFLDALQSRNFAATAITTHPGVVTMWMGAFGLLVRNAVYAAGLIELPTFATSLSLIRTPLVLLHAGCLIAGVAMLRRVFHPAIAACVAVLWATDPFLIGFSRFLHVDGPATAFCLLSLLSAALFWNHTGKRRWLVISGITAALALLSKSPSAAVIGAICYLTVIRAWDGGEQRSLQQRLRYAAEPLLIWMLVCGATVVVCWPALWVDPLGAYYQLRLGVAEGDSPHVTGNFFLGVETPVPGPGFYPTAMPLRMTPWGLIGLLLLPIAYRRSAASIRRTIGLLAFFAVSYLVAITLFENKLERYIMPAYAATMLLASYALIVVLAGLRSAVGAQQLFTRVGAICTGSLLVVAVVQLLLIHPYGVMYFNPLLGGLSTAKHTFWLGTGEGLSDAAAWLNQQDDITGVLVVSPTRPAIQPYLRAGAQSVSPDSTGVLPDKAGYLVLYVRQLQYETLPPPWDAFVDRATPLYSRSFFGVEYVRIYQIPPKTAHRSSIRFGDLQLNGYDMADGTDALTRNLQLLWSTQRRTAQDLMVFVHIIGANGQRIAQADIPLEAHSWTPGRYHRLNVPITIPADARGDQYRVVIGVYNPQSGERLAPEGEPMADPTITGSNAVELKLVDQ